MGQFLSGETAGTCAKIHGYSVNNLNNLNIVNMGKKENAEHKKEEALRKKQLKAEAAAEKKMKALAAKAEKEASKQAKLKARLEKKLMDNPKKPAKSKK